MNKNIKTKEPKYYLNPQGEFVIENYNFAKPFANFFPGIAGPYGIPMWVFYVNRAQAMISFGTKDKDRAILEFYPANKAWQMVPLVGFRTFIKLSDGKALKLYEPFDAGITNLAFNIDNRMFIKPYELKLEEDNHSAGIRITVEYFTIPNDSYAGIVRIVTIKNTSKKTKNIEVLDGLPKIVPFGTSNFFLKEMSRTIEAWMRAENMDKNVPFYKLDVDPADRPEVIHIDEGNFYLSFFYENDKPRITRPIVDPCSIFGQTMDYTFPREFLAQRNFRYPINEVAESKTPCGFSFLNMTLAPGKAKTFYTIIGNMRNVDILNSSVKRMVSRGYLPQKRKENAEIIERLESDIETKSSSTAFDLYAKQTYLDNVVRGGYPVIFNSHNSRKIFYLYSRKHGDLERDYNRFEIEPVYFSQGNGNYRDMNQNRRSDVWFNPQVGDDNIITFINLIQADGFNPLVIQNVYFIVDDEANLRLSLKEIISDKDIECLLSFLCKPFTPGKVIFFLEANKIKPKVSYDDILFRIVHYSSKSQDAKHGEGFWIDHWTYNLDLLESFLGVYPEKLKEILFEKKEFIYFDNCEVVKPRIQKYVLNKGTVKQLHSVGHDIAKHDMIIKRSVAPYVARAQNGTGEIYKTTLINKLLCLTVNKLASLDPFGVGIEMEADKPSWFDALNGLPALFGSSINETFELKRLILFIKKSFIKTKVDSIVLTEEIYNFFIGMGGLLEENRNDKSRKRDFIYWDKSYTLKEEYRQKVKFGFSGKEVELGYNKLKGILGNALVKIEEGLNKALDNKTKIYYSYFINEVTEYTVLDKNFVKPTKFTQRRVPPFLEGEFHAMRLADTQDKAGVLYNAVKKSNLYDRKLKMYKVTAPLKNMPQEIGRCRIFTPGWLEDESIWLHMEYKYILELLKQGLYKEFHEEFKRVLIPFQDPKVYGRSILENCSFIVSSAYPDKTLHGNGFVARLSGSTAEFVEMWRVMNIGKNPFILNKKNELNLRFAPALAGWLFSHDKKAYSFNFLSSIKVTYHNPKRYDTFGKKGVAPKKIVFNDQKGKKVEIVGDTIGAPYAQQIRVRQINSVDVYFE